MVVLGQGKSVLLTNDGLPAPVYGHTPEQRRIAKMRDPTLAAVPSAQES
jgi:hypothetical protein